MLLGEVKISIGNTAKLLTTRTELQPKDRSNSHCVTSVVFNRRVRLTNARLSDSREDPICEILTNICHCVLPGLSRLQHCEMLRVAGQDTPEEPHRQQSVKVGCAGILLAICIVEGVSAKQEKLALRLDLQFDVFQRQSRQHYI